LVIFFLANREEIDELLPLRTDIEIQPPAAWLALQYEDRGFFGIGLPNNQSLLAIDPAEILQLHHGRDRLVNVATGFG